MTLRIDYNSEDFPATGPVPNGSAILMTDWNELLWSALTVGRPNRQYVFQYGAASMYEALFRLSLVRMALEQSGPTAYRLRRTNVARTLDPSEKGAVNYFLGLAICKLFAAKLLQVPWLLHLDVFRPMLNPVLTGRSRPDLVGQTLGGAWVALECKGRLSQPGSQSKAKAKQQAERVVSINGVAPTLKIGGIAYFKNETLRFYWRDPSGDESRIKNPIKVDITPQDWIYHYGPALNIVRSNPRYLQRMLQEPLLMPLPGADIEIGIHPAVLGLLVREDWEGARYVSQEFFHVSGNIRYQSDGIAVVPGPSWYRRLKESEEFTSR
jgi:hypothetical protein